MRVLYSRRRDLTGNSVDDGNVGCACGIGMVFFEYATVVGVRRCCLVGVIAPIVIMHV